MSPDTISIVMVVVAAFALLMGFVMPGRYAMVRLALWTVVVLMALLVGVMFLTSGMLLQAVIYIFLALVVFGVNLAEYKALTANKSGT